MRIHSLSLQNIRSYQEEEFSFSDGITLLSGTIGAGKSSILHAIEFALFGLSKGELSGSYLLRNGAKEGKVTLHCTIDSNEVQCTRTLKRTKSTVVQDSCLLEINGEKQEVSPIELKALVLQLLGYPKELLSKKNLIYKYTVYTPQEEMKRILFEDRETRLSTLRKSFGIEKYKTMRDNTSLLLTSLRSDIRFSQGEIQTLPQEEEQQKELIIKQAELAKQAEILTLDIKKQSEELAAKQAIITHLDEQQKKLVKKKAELAGITTTLQECTRTYTELTLQEEEITKTLNTESVAKDFSTLLKQKEEELAQIKKKTTDQLLARQHIESRKREIVQKLREFEEKISTREDRKKAYDQALKASETLNEIKAKEAKTQEEYLKKQQALIDLQTKRGIANASCQEAKDIKERLSHMTTCPTCLQEISEDYRSTIVKNKENTAEELTKQGTLLAEQELLTQKELSLLQEHLRSHERTKAELQALVLTKETVEKSLIEIEQAVKSKQEFYDEMKVLEQKEKELQAQQGTAETEQKILAAIADLRKEEKEQLQQKMKREQLVEIGKKKEEQKSRIQEYNKSKIIIQREIENTPQLDEKVALIKKEHDELSIQKEKSVAAYTAARTEEELVRKRSQELHKEIAKKQLKKGEISRLLSFESFLTAFYLPLLTTIEQYIFSSLYDTFLASFQKWFRMLVNDETLRVSLDADFTPKLSQQGYDLSVEQLSGGEKTALALSYRLSLNHVITDISSTLKTKQLLILDEPTDGFSDEQLDHMRDILRSLGMQQILIVSHEQKIESYVDRVIHIRKEEGKSGIVS